MNTSSPNAPDPLAVALAKLDPAPHGFEWNALMFAAGRASKGRALTFWRVAACLCVVVACGFAVAYFARPTAVVERERVVYVDRVAPVPPAPVPVPLPVPEVKPEPRPLPPAGWNYDDPPEHGSAARWLSVRNEVLTAGLGVLPDLGPKTPAPRDEQ